MTVRDCTAIGGARDVAVVHAFIILNMTMFSAAAFSVRGNVKNLVAPVNAKSALNAAMFIYRAFCCAQGPAFVYAVAFVQVTMIQRTALLRVRDNVTALRATVVEHSAVGGRATSNFIHGLTAFDASAVASKTM
jgi:hypothetical protein